MKSLLVLALLVAAPAFAQDPAPPAAGPQVVTVYEDDKGWKLQVDGEDFFVRGMNWGYVPVGTNYSYNFWAQPEDFIEEALHREMSLLVESGHNAIRQYVGIPPKWVEWMWRNYGVWTMVNHTVGRYGFSVNGGWVPNTDYSDPATRDAITKDVLAQFEVYKDTPGVLFYLLGNENNYGLSWSSFEIEALPEGEQNTAKARYLYSLFGELVDKVHELDPGRPVAIANGDLQYIDLIAELVPNLDIMGSNVYRGISSRDLFDVVAEKLGVPFVYTEFGSDAYNAREQREDGLAQAVYLQGLWQEIYEHAYGHGRSGTAIGGFTFQWADGWWKYQQEINLDVHDTNASWPNAAYGFDFVEGKNNMNEEWFGICAKTKTDERGHFKLIPREGFYVLKEGLPLDPYAPTTTMDVIKAHWGAVKPKNYRVNAVADKAIQAVEALQKSMVVNVRADVSATVSGGSAADGFQTRVDHTESFYVDLAVNPTPNFKGNVSLNILGNVADNRINEIFFENRGLRTEVEVLDSDGEPTTLEGLQRIKVYGGSFEWKTDWFDLTGFYRTGHAGWGYDGDFFHLYRDVFIQNAVDTYNADSPFGVEFRGKKAFDGLRIALGPELHWGSNPAVIAMYRRKFGPLTAAVTHQEDFTGRQEVTSTVALPIQQTRRTSLYLGVKKGPLNVELGGLMSGTERIGRSFTRVKESESAGYGGSGWDVLEDEINFVDTLGGKAKVSLMAGPVSWYIQGNYRGLVSEAGNDYTITYTGWQLRSSGQGNVVDGITGALINAGPIQIAPHFLAQRPITPALPNIPDHFAPGSDRFYGGVGPRNQRDDPFFVRWNRETYAFEMLIAYDPTPGSWMWQWDNEVREDAKFTFAGNFQYRIQPTATDASLAFLDTGDVVPLPGGQLAQNVWDAWVKMIINPNPHHRIMILGRAGEGQSNGNDPRKILRGGVLAKYWFKQMYMEVEAKFDDWGPYDYHRDFNLTFPFQLRGDLSVGVLKPRFGQPFTRIGIRGQYRTLDEFSNRFVRDPANPDRIGNEWEVGTYVQVSL